MFTYATGFKHLSIKEGITAIELLGSKHQFKVDVTDQPAQFTIQNLAVYDAVIFLHTTGNVLPLAEHRSALQTYIHNGGGYLGIHGAADMGDMRLNWPWYTKLVGASLQGHTASYHYSDRPRQWPTYAGTLAEAPAGAEPSALGPDAVVVTWQPAQLLAEFTRIAAIDMWNKSNVVRTDEWYGFRQNPRHNHNIHVLASLDESSYSPAAGDMGGDHPIIWCQAYQGGRSLYTGLGHRKITWQQDGDFLQHIHAMIRLAAGVESEQFNNACR